MKIKPETVVHCWAAKWYHWCRQK